MNTWYAVDFGTSNSLLAAVDGERHHGQIPLGADGQAVLKTILYAAGPHQWFFGQKAIDEYLQQPTEGRVFKSLKRFLPDESFQHTRVFQETLTLSGLIAKFLKHIREHANSALNRDVTHAVFGCPARFSDSKEAHALAVERLRTAGLAAGFKHIEFCPEPIAAAYKFQATLKEEKLVLMADFGGGTSDFTVQKMSHRPFQDSDVLGISGVSLAGDKYDGVIMKEYIAPHFGSQAGFKKPMAKNVSHFPKGFIKKLCSPADLVMMSKKSVLEHIKDAKRWLVDPSDRERLENLLLLIEDRMSYALFRDIESAKIQLSALPQSPFEFEYCSIDVQQTIERRAFTEASQGVTADIMKALDECLKVAGIAADEVDIVCLTGGTSQLPAIVKELEARFGERLTTSSQFDSVVQGLAMKAQQLLVE